MPEPLFLIKSQVSAYNVIKKEILAQVFSCEFCEMPKNNAYETFRRKWNNMYRFLNLIEQNNPLCFQTRTLDDNRERNQVFS